MVITGACRALSREVRRGSLSLRSPIGCKPLQASAIMDCRYCHPLLAKGESLRVGRNANAPRQSIFPVSHSNSFECLVSMSFDKCLLRSSTPNPVHVVTCQRAVKRAKLPRKCFGRPLRKAGDRIRTLDVWMSSCREKTDSMINHFIL